MKKLYFSYLLPVEIHAFSLRFKPVVEPLLATEKYLAELVLNIDTGTDQLGSALGIEKGSAYTELQLKADSERDLQYVITRNYIEALASHPDESISQAAQFLDKLFEARNKSLHNLSYAAETSQLNNLLKDLETEEAKKAIEIINAGIWVELLKQKQHAFEKVYLEKITTESNKELPLVTESKHNLIKYLSAALSYISMNAELNPAVFSPIAVKLDELIVDQMTIARTRQTKKKQPESTNQ